MNLSSKTQFLAALAEMQFDGDKMLAAVKAFIESPSIPVKIIEEDRWFDARIRVEALRSVMTASRYIPGEERDDFFKHQLPQVEHYLRTGEWKDENL